MTTSFCSLLFQDGGSLDFDVTDSNDAWASCVTRTGADASSVGNQSLGDACPGRVIVGALAETTVGCCLWKIKNNDNPCCIAGVGVNVVAKADWERQYAMLPDGDSYIVQPGDILQMFTVATPT